MPAIQVTTHVKSSTLYGRTSKLFQLDGLLLFCIIMGLCSALIILQEVIVTGGLNFKMTTLCFVSVTEEVI